MNLSENSWRVWQDSQVAGDFAVQRRGGILGAEAQFDTLIRLLRYVPATPMAVLDIGCGDGIVLETVMRAFPVERAVAIDGSPAMIEKAEARFAELGLFSNLVEFVEADFNDSAWLDSLPVWNFDAIVSAFAIHHVEDDRKRALYKELTGLLNPGGVFVNIEHVASVTSQGEDLFEAAYADNLYRHRQKLGQETTPEEVLYELQTRPDKSANRLAPVDVQLGWLRECGLVDVDCYWKHFELAVLAGYRTTVAKPT
jgi:ubiquinone/menaquinone biosynthesis C-methylase UbiE